MLDPAILQSLDAPLPPQVPTIVHERVWQSSLAQQAERIGRRMADSFEADAQKWIGTIERRMKEAEAFKLGGAASPEERRQFAATIEDFEAYGEMRAKEAARLAKQIRRDVKAIFKIDPSLAAIYRSTGERLIAIDKRIIAVILDFALFLRASLAEFDPDSRGGPTFSNGADLAKHLESLLAA